MKTVLMVGTGCMAVVLAATIARSQPAAGTNAAAPAMEHVALAPSQMQWGQAPPVLPKGAKMAVLVGDPAKPAYYAVRLKMPAGYKIMPHWHPTDEHVTVISGALAVGMGDKFDNKAAKPLPAGSFYSMPAKMHHFAWTKGETVVDVTGIGPFAMTYLDPNDDPSKQQASSK